MERSSIRRRPQITVSWVEAAPKWMSSAFCKCGVLREIVGAELAVLKAEIGKTLHYAASKTRGNGIDNVLLVGAVARFPGVAQLLSKEIGLPVDVLDPLSVFPHSLTDAQAAELSPLCGVAVAVGLALRGLPGPGG